MEEITIKDIAKLCGVGVSTVSRAINNHPDINPETKQMIMDVIRLHGYVPNNSARNLKRSDTKCIAVLVKGLSNPFFINMIKTIEFEIKKKKYSMVLHHVEFDEDEADVALELVKEKRLKGIIFLGGHFRHSEKKLAMLQVPFILSTVNREPVSLEESKYSNISVDDEAEMIRAVEYLIENGHKRIALISANLGDESIGELRLSGYKKALEKHNIPFDEELVFPMKDDVESYSMENGYVVAKEMLDSGKEFTAISAISDSLAIGAIRALHDTGKRVPEDYSVMGFDGIELGKYITPSLSTVEQPVYAIAKETTKLLFDVMAGKKDHEHIVVPGKLIIRESTRSI